MESISFYVIETLFDAIDSVVKLKIPLLFWTLIFGLKIILLLSIFVNVCNMVSKIIKKSITVYIAKGNEVNKNINAVLIVELCL